MSQLYFNPCGIFNSLENLEKKETTNKREKYVLQQETRKHEIQNERINLLKQKKELLLLKLKEKQQAIEAFGNSGGSLSSLKLEEKNVLLEIEKKRLNDILTAYRLTGTSIDIVDDKMTRLRFDTSYKGTYYESFYAELRNQGQNYTLEKHSLPSFIPQEGIIKTLNISVKDLCNYIHGYLRAYVQRRQEAFKVQEKHGDILAGDICSTPSFDYIEIWLSDFEELECIKLLYEDLTAVLPTQVVLQGKGISEGEDSYNENLQQMKHDLCISTLSQVFIKLADC